MIPNRVTAGSRCLSRNPIKILLVIRKRQNSATPKRAVNDLVLQARSCRNLQTQKNFMKISELEISQKKDIKNEKI